MKAPPALFLLLHMTLLELRWGRAFLGGLEAPLLVSSGTAGKGPGRWCEGYSI